VICLRCGSCCQVSFVVIVDDPEIGPAEDNLRAINLLEEPCPHLQGDTPGEFSCSIHDRPWYKETPCATHGQIERGNTNCRMGEYVLNKRKEAREEIQMDV